MVGQKGPGVELEGRKFETADFKAAQEFRFFFSGRAGTCQEPGDFILSWETWGVGLAIPILRVRKQRWAASQLTSVRTVK